MFSLSMSFEEFATLLLSLPKELRDMIYEYAFLTEDVLEFAPSKIQHPAEFNHLLNKGEAWERCYRINKFFLDIDSLDVNSWQVGYPQPARFQTRRLVVYATESKLPMHLDYMGYEEYLVDPKKQDPLMDSAQRDIRRKWAALLDFPNLESLEIRMNKWNQWYQREFMWWDFHPIIATLHSRRPSLTTELFITYGKILPRDNLRFDVSTWASTHHDCVDHRDQSLKYCRVTSWFTSTISGQRMYGKASKEDRECVAKYLKDTTMPTRMSDSGPSGHNVFRWAYFDEPLVTKHEYLMRAMMEDQFEFYKTIHSRSLDQKIEH